MFPGTFVDGFYKNPDEIREYALSLDYTKETGNFPGLRTKPLSEINLEFQNNFAVKLFSLFYDFRHDTVEWSIQSYFQKIYPYSEDVDDPLNQGWYHSDDDNNLAAGVIYLNPIPNPNSGTIFGIRLTNDLDYSSRNSLYKNNNLDEIDIDHYRRSVKKHNSSFQTTVEIKNLYNRLIFYDSRIPHRENNFFCNYDEPRLTQVFFVTQFKSENTPLNRMFNNEIQTPRLS